MIATLSEHNEISRRPVTEQIEYWMRRRNLRLGNHQSTDLIDEELRRLRHIQLAREVNRVRVKAGRIAH